MSLVYSYYGFPVEVAVDLPPEERVFHAPVVEAIAKRRKAANRPGFTHEMNQITDLAKTWEITSGFFKAILNPAAKVTPSVRSFVLETAGLLKGTIARRRVGFGDWALLLAPGDDVSASAAAFLADELELVQALADLPTEELISLWVNKLGVDDLSQSLQLYVGEAP